MIVKKDNIIIKVIMNTFVVTFIGTTIVGILDFISKSIVVKNTQAFISPESIIIDFSLYFLSLMLNYLPFVVLCGIVIFFSIKPLQKVYNKLLNDERVNEDEIKVSVKKIFNFNLLIIVINFLGFFLGGLVFIIKEGYSSALLIFFVVLFNIASPGLYAFIQVSINNQILRRLRTLLNIHYIDDKHKIYDLKFQYKNIILFVMIACYGISFIVYNQIKIFETQVYYTSSLESIINKKASIDDIKKEYFKNLNITDKNYKTYPLESGNVKLIKSLNNIYMFISFILILLISLIAIIVYTAEVSQQLKFQKMSIEEILTGKKNISDRISIIQNDEIGKLSDTINRFMDKFKDILFQISNSSGSISEKSSFLNNNVETTSIAIGQMAESNKQISEFTSEQINSVEITRNQLKTMQSHIEKISNNVDNLSAFVEETASALQEMSSSIQSVNQTASKTKTLADELVVITRDGQDSVENTVDAIKMIEDSSNKVMEIIMIMSDISSQTNLLAMNAAIEAAHAGEAGRGFAVVADEIRKLAENSSSQAKEIENHIKTMLSRIDNGVQMSNGAGQAFRKINDDIGITTNLISEVSRSMSEHSDGTNQILSSVSTVVKATEDIRELTIHLKNQSSDIENQINQDVNRSNEIHNDTKKQNERVSEILKLVENVKSISNNNLEDVEKLQNTIISFNFKGDTK